MMHSHLFALSFSLAFYILLCLSFYGWGLFINRILKINEQHNHPEITLIWIGWAITLLLFQIIHLFFPLKVMVVLPIFISGVIFSSKDVARVLRRTLHKETKKLKIAGILLTGIAFAAWIASRSMLPPANYDTGLYHMSLIQWINKYSIVKGLGNLHGRLAFNHSFFTYAASLNLYPLFRYGRSIANSYLVLLAAANLIGYLTPAIKNPSKLLTSHPFEFLPAVFALPILGYFAITSDGLASPSPDFCSAILQLMIFVIFLRNYSEWVSCKKINHYSVLLLTILTATTITIKLSNLIFAVTIFGIVLIQIWRNAYKVTKRIVNIFALSVFVIIVWCLRGFILSGAPLFPTTIGYIPFEWAVYKPAMIEEVNWIYSWARQPDTHWRYVLGNWNWLKPWFFRNLDSLLFLMRPIIFSGIAYVTVRIVYLLKMRQCDKKYWDAILFPLVFSLVYWFFTAPSIRFAIGLFYLLPVAIILLFLVYTQELGNKKLYVICLCLAFVLGNFQFGRYAIENKHVLKHISLSGFQQVQEVPLGIKETSSGLIVNVPVSGDQCWDAPIPCTPYYSSKLELRVPENLSRGFFMLIWD